MRPARGASRRGPRGGISLLSTLGREGASGMRASEVHDARYHHDAQVRSYIYQPVDKIIPLSMRAVRRSVVAVGDEALWSQTFLIHA